MFVYLLVVVLAAAAVHLVRRARWTVRETGETVLLYLLVGYCGIPMLIVSVAMLAYPEQVADAFGFSAAGGAVDAFLGFAYLGMSLIAVGAVWYRGTFLIAPAVCWAVFFAGATRVHLEEMGRTGGLSHGGMLEIFATHGLISVMLVAALLASSTLKRRA